MGDDNPLWYDYAEPAAPPGGVLLAVAGLFSVTARGGSAGVRLFRRAHELWCGRARPRGAHGRHRRDLGRHGS